MTGSMRIFLIYFKSELKRLLASFEGALYIFVQGILIGLCLYGESGATAPSQSPLSRVFLISYRYFALFLPFVFSRLMSPRSDYLAVDAVTRMAGAGRIFAPKIAAGLAFLVASHMLAIPGLLHIFLAGGQAPISGIILLFLSHFAYGFLVLAVTLFCSSIVRARFSAVYASVCVLILPYIVEIAGAHSENIVLSDIASLFVLIMRADQTALLILPVISVIVIFLAYAIIARGPVRIGPLAFSLCAIGAVYSVFALLGRPLIASWSGDFPAISSWDLLGIPAFYFVIFPLSIGTLLLARKLGFGLKDPARKKAIVCVGTWLVILAMTVHVHEFYIKNPSWKFFASAKDILPMKAIELFEAIGPERIIHDLDRPDPILGNGAYLYSGENNRFLQRFFRKLSDLKSGRRDVVRIVHYGDSQIWGDCYAKTVKRRFQKEFGDGGRGIVPPVETGPTALQDYVNKTSPGAFNLYAIKHKFRGNGAFRVRPEINSMIGFTGEGIYPLSSASEIRLGTQSGFQGWKRVQVFVRAGANSDRDDRVTVNLDYGAGTERRVVSLGPDGAAAAMFEISPAESVGVKFDWSGGGPPAVDAVNLETGKGVAYSTIVRMGIHMSWMNAVPERNLRTLRTINPDLLIFQFGINEAASLGAFPEFTEGTLRSQIREWLARVKKVFPETDVLLIGPPERLHMEQNSLVPMKETLVVRKVQAEEATAAGMAFFDTYRHLGGEGHMLSLAKNGMAMNDYTHFTYKGGDFAADGFFDSLMGRYQNRMVPAGQEVPAPFSTGMRFNSAAYLFFLAIIIVIGFVLRPKPWLRFSFLIAASYYFYATWEAWPLLCLAATTITDFSMARLIAVERRLGRRGSVYLAVSLFVDLGILFTLKYFDFFSELASWGLRSSGFSGRAPLLNILLPAGISFYTFQSLSYTIDVWRGRIEPEKSFIRYAHYVSLFTQLLAGPIVKAREFLPPIKNGASHFRLTGAHAGVAVFLILSGLIKKTAADWLGVTMVDRVFASPHMFLPLETLAAVYAYGMQIYGDFSGYTDIAIGSAMLLGYNLTENFRRPYVSASVSEFWQRWHISLGSWLRDYVYIGLGGNRKRVLLNIGITMLVCGLWHGAALPFILWGLYHGFFMILERVSGLNKSLPTNPFIKGLRVFITLHIVLFGWILFRAGSWTAFAGIIASFSKFSAAAPNVGLPLVVVMAALYILHFTPVEWKERLKFGWMSMPGIFQGAAASCVTVVLYNISVIQAKPFIYFQF